MSNINFELNLNKHPKDCKDRSLIWAENVQISNDGSCLQSEFSITNSFLNEFFKNKIIIGQIPCNTEIIFFATDVGDKKICKIYRYDENLIENNIKLIYDKLEYHGGKIIGTFTYNVQNHLIIAFSEYDCENGVNIPLKTLDCGTFDNDIGNINNCDLGLPDSAISLNPKIKIPSIEDFNYIPGQSYKGYYHFFIRFKINNNDYTSWYNIGYPIFVDDIQTQTIFDYHLINYYSNNAPTTEHQYTGFTISDAFSDENDVCNKRLSIDLNFDNNLIFKTYQIGFIIVSKEYRKAFRSIDLNIKNNNYIVDIKNTYESSIEELTTSKYNYYDVKNIINDKNKLYISNFKEYSNDISNINLSLFKASITKSFLDLQRKTKKFPLNIQLIYIGQIKHPHTLAENKIFGSVNINDENYKNNVWESYYQTIIGDAIPDKNSQIYICVNNTIIFGKEIEYNEHGELYTIGYNIDREHNVVIKVKFAAPFEHEGNKTLLINYNITSSWDVGTEEILIYDANSNKESFENRLKSSTLLPNSNYKFYIHYINEYGEVSDGYALKKENYIINTDIFDVDDDGIVSVKDYNKRYNDTFELFHFNIGFDGILPTGYGYFVSYEKFIKSVVATGYLTEYDFVKSNLFADKNGNKDYNKDSLHKNIYRFYSSDIDLLNEENLNVTKLTITNNNDWLKVPLLLTQDYNKYIYSGNAYEGMVDNIKQTVLVKNIQIIHNHDFTKDNDYRGSYLEIETYEPISFFTSNVSLKVELSYDALKYTNENKILIKFTNAIYDTNNHIIDKGLNGRITFNNQLVYNNNKFIISAEDKVILNKDYYSYIHSAIFGYYDNNDYIPDYHIFSGIYQIPVIYTMLPCYNDVFYESKCFDVKPEVVVVRQEKISKDNENIISKNKSNIIVRPENSNRLFKLRFSSQDDNNPLTYININENNVTEFNKRIQRSNQILDESFENNWRTFNVNDYKDITEPKGNITNLISFGTTFLAHTEHSLFMFDTSNTLKTQDKDIQLANIDVFDIQYVEVFTSELGVCGLQDKCAYIADTFGYIFYDNDAHKIYLFSKKEIKEIDISIEQFLNKYKPYKIRFANDKQSNRILMCINYYDNLGNDNIITLSYNYKYNIFISTHNYYFTDAFNTKNLLYLYYGKYNKSIAIINNLINNRDASNTNKNLKYNNFINILNNNKRQTLILIIVNSYYELIKTIEFITYKLYKIKSNSESSAIISTPVEEYRHPFAGDYIRIYNDLVDSGKMDVKIISDTKLNSIMNYDKPHWELGNWNFNYFRNKIAQDSEQIADDMSRLYGNYFIIEFYCNTTNIDERIEFETFDCQLTNNPTI